MNRHVLLVALLTSVVFDASAQAARTASTVGWTSSVGSPNQRLVSLDLKDVTLEEAIKAVSKQANVKIIYDADAVPLSKKVSYSSRGVTPVAALAAILRGSGFTVKAYSSGEIAIVRIPAKSQAQGVITGRVMEGKTGKGVPGATVSTGNDTRGVITGDDGSFRLTGVPAGTHIVTVRLVGYAKQVRTVTVSDDATVKVDFSLDLTANVLDQVVVTGTVVSTELKAIPNAITVITAKQIEERGIVRIDQLFRGDIPGLFSVNMGSNALLDQVSMYSRGATAISTSSAGVDPNTGNSNPIKTYIDGVEMVDPKYLSQIDPSSIERIEILTGPQASTIYGSNAINGVMQIFTKRGKSARPQIALSFVSGLVENNFSSASTPVHTFDGHVSGTEGRWSYNVGGSWDYTGPWTPAKQTQRVSGYGGGRIDMVRLTADISARQGLTRNKQNGDVLQGQTDLRASGIWVNNNASGLNAGLPYSSAQAINGRTIGLSLGVRPFSWWSHELVLGSDASDAEYVVGTSGFGRPSDTSRFIDHSTTTRTSERYSSTVQVSVSSIAGFNFTLGGDHWRTSGWSWNASPPLSLTGTLAPVNNLTRFTAAKNTGVYAQGQLGIKDVIFLTYGLRTDWNPTFGDQVKVQPGRYGISITRDFGALSAKLRGSYGRSIRPPGDEKKLASPILPTSPTNIALLAQYGPYDSRLANPDLAPEYQQGGEGGIELYLGSRGSLIITRYNQTVNNLISLVSRVDSVRSLEAVAPVTTNCNSFNFIFTFDAEGHCFRYQNQNLNVGSIRNQGWELQSNVNIGPLTTRGTYSWVKSRTIGVTPKYRPLLTSSQFQPGRSFNFIPEHTWALGLTYAHSLSTVSLFVNGTGMLYRGTIFITSASGNSRLKNNVQRMDIPSGYTSPGPSYATADLSATHRFSAHVDALLQITNLSNAYQSDYGADYAVVGRQTKIGVRLH